MKQMPVTIAVDALFQLAENPIWDAEKNCLYWTDITAGKIHSWDYATQEHRTIYEGEPVGGFTLQTNGDLLLFRVNDIALLSSDGNVTSLRKFSHDGMRRFNDVIADPRGRVFAGTIGDHPKCGLYRIDLDGTAKKLFAGTGCSNGMGFSPDCKTFYWTNTTTREIFQFDFDAESGALSNRGIFYTTKPDEGIPDGLTVDSEGYVWSARWAGSSVIRHSPDGAVMGNIAMPALNVTSICFGGKNFDELFITAAKNETDEDSQGEKVFHTRVGVRGKNEFRSQIAVA